MNYVNLQDTRVNLDMISAYEAVSIRNGRPGYYIGFATPSADYLYVQFQTLQQRNDALERLDRITSPHKGI